MPQAISSTTAVRMAVARLELTPLTPTFARIEVRAANTADSNANTNHITIGHLYTFQRLLHALLSYHNAALYARTVRRRLGSFPAERRSAFANLPVFFRR